MPDPNTPAEPTVKITPDFKKGEVVTEKVSGVSMTITEITADGNLRIAGRAGLMPPTGVEKKI